MSSSKNKGRRNLIIVISLLSITIVSGYFIDSWYNQKNSIMLKNTITIADKAKEVAVIENESQLKPETLTKSEDIKPINVKHNDKGIPILMYHSIGYEQGSLARVTKENFKNQMKYLKDNGYVTLTLNDAYDFFINNKTVPEKSIVLTFDDGYEDNYLEALPILKEFKFKATIFVITDSVDKSPDYMTSVQLKEIQANGFDIESHTTNHENLKESSYEKQVKSMQDSKDYLEKILDKKIEYIAYPYGEYSKETLKAVTQVGYKMAVGTAGRWSDKSDGILTLDRVFISGAASLDIFIERITNPNYKF
jgi:peptidoglycan/xylan/chitin deacetylase (PgdA/CDA1 family)